MVEDFLWFKNNAQFSVQTVLKFVFFCDTFVFFVLLLSCQH